MIEYRATARLVVLVLCGLWLAACSVPLADLPSPIGVPAGAPARPATEAAYPAVHDMPAARQDTLLEPTEQERLQRELRQARDRQESRAGVSGTGTPSK